nr:uncharacterized protein LOC112733539 [Arachis hypogaea]
MHEEGYANYHMEEKKTPPEMQENNVQPQKASYRDRLMNDGFEKLNPEEIVEMVAEEYLSGDDVMDHEEVSKVPFNPKPNIEVTLEEYDEWCRSWKQSLIVKPLGNKLSLQTMERWANRRWTKNCTIREDYGYALFEGPWMIADHYLLIQRWCPLFLPQETEVQKVAVWVRIPNLPTELYNKYFLWKVGKSIGTMLKVDEHTSIHSRGKFARICVEVDQRKQLVPSFSALGKDFYLVYEGLDQICFNCGRYGHRLEGCPEKENEVAAIGGRKKMVNELNHHEGVAAVFIQN